MKPYNFNASTLYLKSTINILKSTTLEARSFRKNISYDKKIRKISALQLSL